MYLCNRVLNINPVEYEKIGSATLKQLLMMHRCVEEYNEFILRQKRMEEEAKAKARIR